MPSEHAFLRQRLALVERWLAEDPDRELIYDGKGRARCRIRPSNEREVTRERGEACLLRELLVRTREGPVLMTQKARLRRYLMRLP